MSIEDSIYSVFGVIFIGLGIGLVVVFWVVYYDFIKRDWEVWRGLYKAPPFWVFATGMTLAIAVGVAVKWNDGALLSVVWWLATPTLLIKILGNGRSRAYAKHLNKEAKKENDARYTSWRDQYDKYKPRDYFIKAARSAWLEVVGDKHRALIADFIENFAKNNITLNGFQSEPDWETQFSAPGQMEEHKMFLQTAHREIDKYVDELTPVVATLSALRNPRGSEDYLQFIDLFLDTSFRRAKHQHLPNWYSDIAGALRGMVGQNLSRHNIEQLAEFGVLKQSPTMTALLNMYRERERLNEQIQAYNSDNPTHGLEKKISDFGYRQATTSHTDFVQFYYDQLQNTGLDVFRDWFLKNELETDLLEFPEAMRFEHCWIVGGSGAGKTTLMKNLIKGDFERVKRGEASMIIMESKRDLIEEIRNLKIFAEGQPLDGKLIEIDVEQRKVPIALNPFDVGVAFNELSEEDKELAQNDAVSLISYFFQSLMSETALSGLGEMVLIYLTNAMMVIDGANIDTFHDAVKSGGSVIIKPHLDKLDKDTRDFFTTTYDTKALSGTRQAIERRIFKLKQKRVLARIFRSPATRLNIFKEIGQAKVILINCSRAYLKEEVETFGRYMLALILNAIERRQTIPETDRLPTFCYIDEAHDILAHDKRIHTILTQARSANFGMVIAHQTVGQMSSSVQDKLRTNTSIKCMHGLEGADAKRMASSMRMDARDVECDTKGMFAVSVKGLYSEVIKPQFVEFKKMNRMSSGERQKFETINNQRYGIPSKDLQDIVTEIGGDDLGDPEPI